MAALWRKAWLRSAAKVWPVSTTPARYRYLPASVALSDAVDTLAELYGRKPMAVTNAILSSRNDKIRTFADAFRFRN